VLSVLVEQLKKIALTGQQFSKDHRVLLGVARS